LYSLPPASGLGSAWISEVADNSRTGGCLDNFGTLGAWIQAMPAGPSHIRKAGANYLNECRNREAHQYITGTRRSRYRALSLLLVPFFNELIADLRANSHPTT